jgi:hypothetical protein
MRTGPLVHPAYVARTGDTFSGVKWPGSEANDSPPSNDEVMSNGTDIASPTLLHSPERN